MKEIIIIALLVAIVVLAWAYTRLWEKKEHYRCRVFDLTNGEEGSNLPKVTDTPPPTPLKPAPQGMFPERPLLVEWLHNNCGEYFRRSAVVALTKNPNGTINVVLGNGHSINTGMKIDEVKEIMGINFICSCEEELEHRRNMKGL